MKTGYSRTIGIMLAVSVLGLGATALNAQTQPGPFDGQIKTTRHFDLAFNEISLLGIVASAQQRRAIIRVSDDVIKTFRLHQSLTVTLKDESVIFRIVAIEDRQIILQAENEKTYRLAV